MSCRFHTPSNLPANQTGGLTVNLNELQRMLLVEQADLKTWLTFFHDFFYLYPEKFENWLLEDFGNRLSRDCEDRDYEQLGAEIVRLNTKLFPVLKNLLKQWDSIPRAARMVAIRALTAFLDDDTLLHLLEEKNPPEKDVAVLTAWYVFLRQRPVGKAMSYFLNQISNQEKTGEILTPGWFNFMPVFDFELDLEGWQKGLSLRISLIDKLLFLQRGKISNELLISLSQLQEQKYDATAAALLLLEKGQISVAEAFPALLRLVEDGSFWGSKNLWSQVQQFVQFNGEEIFERDQTYRQVLIEKTLSSARPNCVFLNRSLSLAELTENEQTYFRDFTSVASQNRPQEILGFRNFIAGQLAEAAGQKKEAVQHYQSLTYLFDDPKLSDTYVEICRQASPWAQEIINNQNNKLIDNALVALQKSYQQQMQLFPLQNSNSLVERPIYLSEIVTRFRLAVFLQPNSFEKQITALVENLIYQSGSVGNLQKTAKWFFGSDFGLGGHQEQAELTKKLRQLCLQKIETKFNDLNAFHQWWDFFVISYENYPEKLSPKVEQRLVSLLPVAEQFEKKLSHLKMWEHVRRAEKILTFLAQHATQKETLQYLTHSLREQGILDFTSQAYQQTLSAKVRLAGRLAAASFLEVKYDL